MNIFIYKNDHDRDKIAVIDFSQSIILNTRLTEIGDFEIKIPLINEDILQYIQLGYFVRASYDNSKWYVIREIERNMDNENGNYLIFRGEEIKSLLTQRLVIGQINLNGTIENNFESLLHDVEFVDDYKFNQGIYLLARDTDTTTYDFQFDFEILYNAFKTVADRGNYYFTVDCPHDLRLILFKAVETNNIVFSQAFNNILSFNEKINTYDFCNRAVVVGEGSGTAKKYQLVTTSETNKNMFFFQKVDATEISSNSGVITQTEYNNFLKNQGESYINANNIKKIYEMQVDTRMYSFPNDFDIGYKVKIVNPINGEILTALVTEVTEKWDDNGYICEPKFEILNN